MHGAEMTCNSDRDRGSLTIFITTLFLLVLLLGLETINISSTYLAKRELIITGEGAIQRAAHTIDLDRYYQGDLLQLSATGNSSSFKVPIDCEGARREFVQRIGTAQLRGGLITISNWNCSQDSVSAALSAAFVPPLTISFLGLFTGRAQTITAEVGATSIAAPPPSNSVQP